MSDFDEWISGKHRKMEEGPLPLLTLLRLPTMTRNQELVDYGENLLFRGKTMLSGEFHPEYILFHRPKRSPGSLPGGWWRWEVF